MPVEGLEPQTQTDSNSANTPDAAVNNTDAENTARSGAATDTAKKEDQAQNEEKKFTQADLDRHLQTRLKSALKAELKKLSGDGDIASVDELKKQLSETQAKARAYEARESVRDFLSDAENKLNIKAGNIPVIVELVERRLEFDEATGKPTNLKDAIKAVKALSPDLFANIPASIDAVRRNGAPVGNDMNAWIRQQAGHGN